MALPGRPGAGFAQKVLELLNGISDPSIRVEVMRTLYFLAQMYINGAPEEEVVNDMTEAVATVVKIKEPHLTSEQVLEKARKIVDEIMVELRAEAMMRRLIRKARGRMPLPGV